MITVTSVETMQKSDKIAIESRIKSKDLMFYAGTKVYENLGVYKDSAIVCGTGNNAGDGYVIALKLKERGLNVKLFLVKEKFSEDGKYFFDKCIKADIPFELLSDKSIFKDFDVIIDCVLGTGFYGKLSDELKFAITKINAQKLYTISVDINSGLNGDNGIFETAVFSDLTISIGNYKSGHFLNSAKDCIKELKNVDIAVELVDKPFYLLEAKDAKQIFLLRKNNSHKGTYGNASIIGGSLNYSGAVKLTNLSLCALRCGAGLSNVIIPQSLSNSVLPYLLESTLSLIDDKNGEMIFSEASLSESLKKTTSLLVGIGWGVSIEKQKILKYILDLPIPVIIDADGINNLVILGVDLLKSLRLKLF